MNGSNYLVSASLAALTFFCAGALLFWLRYAARRVVAERGRQSLLVMVATGLFGWLLFVTALSAMGVFTGPVPAPGRIVLLPLTALFTFLSISRGALLPKLLAATPRHWPVAFQSFRILVELSFLGFYVAGSVPVQVTFEGRNFDILVGLTAPIVAFGIAKFSLSPRYVIAWNLLGIAVLLNTIFTVLTSVPGVLSVSWAQPLTTLGSWPLVWIPAFLAPLAIFLHVSSIRQNIAFARKSALR